MFYVMIFPTLILFIPVLINKKISWFLALSFSILHSIWSIYKIISDNINNNYLNSLEDKIYDFIFSSILIIILFSISYLIFKIKPKN